MIRILLLLALTPSLSGCMLAARQVAVAHHKGQTADHARQDFPPGTPIETIRTTLTGRGYACTEGAAGVALQCDPGTRSKGMFRGNWRLSFTATDGRLATVRATKAPKPAKAPAAATGGTTAPA